MQRIQLKDNLYGLYAGNIYDIIEVPDNVAKNFAERDYAIILGDEIGETKSPDDIKPKKKRKYTKRKRASK